MLDTNASGSYAQPKKSEGTTFDMNRSSEIIARFLICCLPLVPLFDLRNVFAIDWINHLWMIQYFGEYLKRHHVPPDVFSTTPLVGIALPLFYSSKFYATIGVISGWAGSAVAFRVITFLSLLVQFCHVERAARSVRSGRLLSFAIASAVTWGIYPLTNLYNRGALTEFIAVSLLNTAITCLFVLSVRLADGRKSYYDAAAAGFFLTAASVTHPLTALFGSIFFVSIGFAALLALRSYWLIAVGILNAILIAIVLAPWYYLVHRFGSLISFGNSEDLRETFRTAFFFPNGYDNFWFRLLPLHLYHRALDNGYVVGIPNLDAAITLPLVVLGVALFWIWVKRGYRSEAKTRILLLTTLIFSAGLFVLCFAVSINPSLSARFQFLGVFDILQFPYRLTTYINLAALTAVLALAGLANQKAQGKIEAKFDAEATAFGICVILSFCFLLIKLSRVHPIDLWNINRNPWTKVFASGLDRRAKWCPGFFSPGFNLIDLPTSFYGAFSYSIMKGFATYQPTDPQKTLFLQFVPSDLSNFGKAPSIKVELDEPTLVVTNVYTFPWNMLFVDGILQPRGKILAFPSDLLPSMWQPVVESVNLPVGQHVLQYRFMPDKTWRTLNVISWIALLVWAAGLSLLAWFRLRDAPLRSVSLYDRSALL
jgi:hypothetical protein